MKESGEHDGRPPGPGRSPEHEPDLLRLRPRVSGKSENADANAAKNILGAGQARSACSEAKTSESAA